MGITVAFISSTDRISFNRQRYLFSVSFSASCMLLYRGGSKVASSDYLFETFVKRITSKHTVNANVLGICELSYHSDSEYRTDREGAEFTSNKHIHVQILSIIIIIIIIKRLLSSCQSHLVTKYRES